MKKVKIIISAVLVTVLSVSIIGCGKDKGTTEGDNKSSTQSSEVKDGGTNDNKKTYQKDPSLVATLSQNLSKVKYSIDYPWSISDAGTGSYSTEEDMYVIYDQFVAGTSDTKYEIDPTKITKPDQIIEGMKFQFNRTATNRLPLSTKRDYIISKKTNVTINGWDMCRYEGEFTLDNVNMITLKDKKAPFVAYGVIKDEHPFYFIVVDTTDNHDKIKDIGVLADKIAKTFRELDKN